MLDTVNLRACKTRVNLILNQFVESLQIIRIAFKYHGINLYRTKIWVRKKF